jgi:hypothetical protein
VQSRVDDDESMEEGSLLGDSQDDDEDMTEVEAEALLGEDSVSLSIHL